MCNTKWLGFKFSKWFFKNSCELLRIKKIQSTAFHRETQGSLEKNHRVCEQYRHCIKEGQTNWDDNVPLSCMCRETINTEHWTHCTHTFQWNCWRHCTLPSALLRDPSPQYNSDDWLCGWDEVWVTNSWLDREGKCSVRQEANWGALWQENWADRGDKGMKR